MIAGLLFILPGAVLMLILSIVYIQAGELPIVAALFFGLSCAVVAIVLQALLRVATRALRGVISWALAGSAFLALFVFSVPFPLVVIGAGLAGFLLHRHLVPTGHGGMDDDGDAALDRAMQTDSGFVPARARSARRAGLLALLAWLAPIIIFVPNGGIFGDVVLFFSKMAIVTFGGAYAVLAYVAQEAVVNYQWLSSDQMLTGLGLAETTPGPLILVLQFVGFLAGYKASAGFFCAVLAAFLTLWVTFSPCFAFVFLGAPAVERIQGISRLTGAMTAITAAVVGVIANLACWFGLRVLFTDMKPVEWGFMVMDMPVISSIDGSAAIIILVAMACLFRFRLGVIGTLGLCAVIGVGLRFIFG